MLWKETLVRFPSITVTYTRLLDLYPRECNNTGLDLATMAMLSYNNKKKKGVCSMLVWYGSFLVLGSNFSGVAFYRYVLYDI